MKPESKLAAKIKNGDFIITAEYLPRSSADISSITSMKGLFDGKIDAVNVADNHYGVVVSSLAASTALIQSGIEPVLQMTTRDRNRIALQSDLLGAALLGIKNVLCLTGYHQTLGACAESSNVFDLDSIQLIAAVKKMNEEGLLLDGTKVDGSFSMLIGAVANPYLNPLELNIMRLKKKINAGARFIQTQAVFEVETFQHWLETINAEGLSRKAAIIAGVKPFTSVSEIKRLYETYTDFNIPEGLLSRLSAAGSEKAQSEEALLITSEILKKLKNMNGLSGIHILSGGHEDIIPVILENIL